MTHEERIRAAIAFETPDCVPLWFHNRDQMRGDVLWCDLSWAENGVHEWGYVFKHLNDGTMGQPEKPVLPDYDGFAAWPEPPLRREARLERLAAFSAGAEDRYRVASLGISGFTTFCFIRGFANAVMDLLTQPPEAFQLLDRIFSFETRLLEIAAEAGMQGIHFADDWGGQQGLLIDPALWREIFKERYRAQFHRAHELGLQVWFHCCGNLLDIAEDFHEIGVDVLNISQPNVVDIAEVGRRLCGKQCFMVPISYQTVSIAGTPDEIHEEARRLYDLLAVPSGGFIGYIEEYGCMGMSKTNYQACVEAFSTLR